jgi:hypothetical protein
MAPKYFLMTWPNLSVKERFYVQERSKGCFVIGHLTDHEKPHYYEDHTHKIDRKAYESLKKQAIETRQYIIKANRKQQTKMSLTHEDYKFSKSNRQ